VYGSASNTTKYTTTYGVYGENHSKYGGGVGGVGYIGVYGTTSSTDGFAGRFDGEVYVHDYLYKNGGGFKIDHPLDPAKKYLYHSFVESPDMMNIYNGNISLDGNGEAWVQLPDWFEVLNMDFRYQLTCIGGFAKVYIAEEVQNNRFRIAGGEPGMLVSWQVTGVRHDPWAQANRLQAEQAKLPEHQGQYLHPELYDQPVEQGIGYPPQPE
jgi:hypothetical protein